MSPSLGCRLTAALNAVVSIAATVGGPKKLSNPGAGIMEADERQMTTVFTVQPSFHHRHSSNPVS